MSADPLDIVDVPISLHAAIAISMRSSFRCDHRFDAIVILFAIFQIMCLFLEIHNNSQIRLNLRVI